MLGSVHESKPSDAGDIDPRALGAVVLLSGLMALAIGAGMLLTGSGARGTAESIPDNPAPRRTQSTMVRPTRAVVPPVPPGPPHPVQPPILLPLP